MSKEVLTRTWLQCHSSKVCAFQLASLSFHWNPCTHMGSTTEWQRPLTQLPPFWGAVSFHLPTRKRSLDCRYEVVDRLVQGLSGLFLALRRRPVIRYQRNSEYARRLAESLYSLTYKQQVMTGVLLEASQLQSTTQRHARLGTTH